MRFQPFFTTPGVHPYEQIEWERRLAQLKNSHGDIIFEQPDVEVPAFWSQTATNIVAQKYLHGALGTPAREDSVKQLISRVAQTITAWGQCDGYFDRDEDADIFGAELTQILAHQYAAFNSPVYFNVGISPQPQVAACFINAIDDTMESILDLAKTEGLIFKNGSGAGVNLSPLRSSREHVHGGGTASGPVSFMRGYDAFAGVIRSGGKVRRAAKMVILNADHPDIIEFINCKMLEERKAHALIEQGYSADDAYSSIFFQNANNSVRVTDDFMAAVEHDADWPLRAVTTGEAIKTIKARELLHQMATAAHACGDPGLQYDTTINAWNTCANSGRIDASNPCAEHLGLPFSACNLASINLLRFLTRGGRIDIESLLHVVQVMIIAQDILIDNAGYPDVRFADVAHRFRPLGIGFTNLGALLMALGLPYDSEAGRAYAAVLTALITGQAYKTSALLAKYLESGEFWAANHVPMLDVLHRHAQAVTLIDRGALPQELLGAAHAVWDMAETLAQQHGVRNSQVSLCAPTGTISFMLDCDTTGIEPELALIKYKHLAGGGTLKIINGTVNRALTALGYTEAQQQPILQHLSAYDTIENAPGLKAEDAAVFDCAFLPLNGTRAIHYLGHLKMMAAVQPFLSGAISKTVNVPQAATVADIESIFISAWRMGLKAVAVYRDGSKRVQPLTVNKTAPPPAAETAAAVIGQPVRRRLPDEREAITHKFSVGGHEGYITVGKYPDGTPGELFLTISKEGSTISGLMDAFATAVSLALQYGVPLDVLVDKFTFTRFEPAGFTSNPQIRMAKSILDYIFRWLALKFMTPDGLAATLDTHLPPQTIPQAARERQVFQAQSDAPACATCGAIMVRSGTCYKCLNCGATSGCS